MAMPVMADEETTINNVVYFKDGEVAKVKNSPSATGEITIESSVTIGENSLTVWGIEHNAFENNTSITKVTIPSSVEYIGYSAFCGCTGLVTVVNNATITQIEAYVFAGCTNLEYCNIPSSVTNIGESAFQGSYKFSNLVIPGNVTIKQNAFNGCKGLKALYILGTSLTIENGNAFWFITDDSDPDKCPKFYARNSMVNTIKKALHDGEAYWLENFVSDEIPYTPAKEYTTFCRDFDVDFSAATGLKAGVATTDLNGTMLKLTVKTSIPAGTGVVLKKLNEGEYKLKIAEKSPEAIVGNKLVGVVAPTAIPQTDGGNTNFVLKDGVFKKVSANNNTLPAGKAYLQLPTPPSAPNFTFSFEDDITGINMIQGDELKMNGYYNLAGQHVANPTKGLYIINGKKVVVK